MITSCDPNPHLREDRTRAGGEELEKVLPVMAEAAGADPDAVAQRYHALRERTRGGEEPTAASGGVSDYHAQADAASTEQNGKAHVWNPITNAHLVCRLQLEKQTMLEQAKRTNQSTKQKTRDKWH